MKFDALLDDLAARALNAAWLRDALAPASPYGERIFDGIGPFMPGQERDAAARAQRVAGIARSLAPAQLDALREIFRNVPDAATALARASMGDALNDAHLLELQRYFDACERLDAIVEGIAQLERTANDAVRATARALELGRAGKFGFYLSDGFDGALAQQRAQLARAQAEYDAAHGRNAAAVARQLGREISGPEFIVMRADLAEPLPRGVRVVREAPTYLLCELDADEATLAALSRRDEAAAAVAAAEEAVRGRLSALVRERAVELDASLSIFGETDVLVSASRFTQAHHASAASVVAEPIVAFENGVFAPLAAELEREGRTFAPIAVHLGGRAVLTGPNMGGKSVCLRTCGFIALCAAFGVPVPARDARVGLFGEIAWLGVGNDDESGGLLSSFAREVVRLRDVLARDRTPMLVLLDEFARTTTPNEGRSLLVAVLRRLGERGALGFAATHLAGVAESAGVRHFAVRGLQGIPRKPAVDDIRAALETLAASMDYTIEEVSGDAAGGSDAIALAALLGLDDALVRDAYDALEK